MSVPEVLTEIETIVTKRHRLRLDREAVIELLQAHAHPPTDDAEVFAQIPGGGDWSNERLDIGADAALEITWEETEES